MLLFVKVMFWVGLVGEIIRLYLLGNGKYPRETSRAMDSINSMVNIPFVVWAAYLIWG